MKKLIISIAIASIFVACGGGAGSIKSDTDSVAYAIGMVSIAPYIKTIDSTISVDQLAAGIKDALANDTKMDLESANAFLKEYFEVRLPAKIKKASDAFLAEVETRDNVKKTESGLLYEIIIEGDMSLKPGPADQVAVLYEGKLKDGSVFESSIAKSDTVDFYVSGVIPGWGEGLQLIGKGGKIKLWIPSELAYGDRGQGKIGPNEALEFLVELVDVIPTPVVEEEAK